MNKSLVLVGMNVRPLAQSAVAAGFDVVALDAFGHRDLSSRARCLSLASDLGGLFPGDPGSWHTRLAQAVRSQRASSLAYSGEFENLPELVAEMSGDFELLGNEPANLRAARDPSRLREVVCSIGMETPQMLPPGVQPDPGLRWLRKPLKSGMGYAIESWESTVPDDLDYVVQRWVEGIPHSASFIANGHDAQVFAVTQQLSGDPAFGARGFAYVGNLLIPKPDTGLMESLNVLVTTLTQAFGLVGLNGIDFIVNGEQLSILEVNPRYSASMELIEEAEAWPLLLWHIDGCRRQALPVLPERHDRNVFGKALVYARRDGILPDTTHWLAQGRRDVPHAGGPFRVGFPICTVTAVGRDQQLCYAHLLAEADELFTIINFAVRRGWKVGTHAIGDRALRTLLDVYEQVIQENPGLKPGTLVLEHGFLADAVQRARAIRLGVPVTVQHPLLYTLGSVLLDGWGKERTREIMPVQAWLDEGASLSAGTDHPVSSFNPLLALWGMVTRGTLKAGILGPEYAINRYTAVQLYTVAGAQLNGESHRRGTLEARKLADLVAFRSNPITCPIDDLPSLRPVFTMVGGRAVYDPEFLIRMTG